ncbi:hypothetical protein THAOC_01795 [Thalassiosira oceanica]|uniref:Uncharacterized protein n=1 Tax=Thalassiosira oceanica TaxID=159749 RepID=K0TQQ2_THAOC|nr:hypothetical protein THAOC_01795 [Thalassiosira oceanica]|eukprot:EJK76442.1 hypothetical protein THAOC_01795 [Thalassiosira oceanica]
MPPSIGPEWTPSRGEAGGGGAVSVVCDEIESPKKRRTARGRMEMAYPPLGGQRCQSRMVRSSARGDKQVTGNDYQVQGMRTEGREAEQREMRLEGVTWLDLTAALRNLPPSAFNFAVDGKVEPQFTVATPAARGRGTACPVIHSHAVITVVHAQGGARHAGLGLQRG